MDRSIHLGWQSRDILDGTGELKGTGRAKTFLSESAVIIEGGPASALLHTSIYDFCSHQDGHSISIRSTI
jgi:hypothetical protein